MVTKNILKKMRKTYDFEADHPVSKAAWEKAQTALARAGLPPMQEIENVLLQELKRLEQANTKLVHARLALEACDSELSELFARAEARKAGVYNEDDDLREQTTNTGSLPSDLQNIHTDDEEDDDLQVVDNKRKNTHDGDNDEEEEDFLRRRAPPAAAAAAMEDDRDATLSPLWTSSHTRVSRSRQ